MKGVTIGNNPEIDQNVTIGDGEPHPTPVIHIGDNPRIRAGTIIYPDVTIGDNLRTGHHALIRSDTNIADDVLVGTGVVIDGECSIGSHVSLQTRAYIPRHTILEDRVFVGPHAVMTNDPHPVRNTVDLRGPTIKSGVSVGANATILPDVTIGKDAFVGAGAVVTEDVPPETLAIGTPATHHPLPTELTRRNQIA